MFAAEVRACALPSFGVRRGTPALEMSFRSERDDTSWRAWSHIAKVASEFHSPKLRVGRTIVALEQKECE